MPGRGRSSCLAPLLLLLLLHNSRSAAAQRASGRPSLWRTLNGDVPLVIAKGGHSGLFPDSSIYAYADARRNSLSNAVMWCDVRLTKDGVGICLPDIKLDNCTVLGDNYHEKTKSYVINGVRMTGWFSLDYNHANLSRFLLSQRISSRILEFDGLFPILSVEDVVAQLGPTPFWLNIQHDMFYTQHSLSMRRYLLSIIKRVIIDYVSSPEVSFLRGIAPRFKGSKTQLIFRFLEADVAEPSTNQTYGALLSNLTFIKTFASGILLPKSYIWPISPDLYQQPYTPVVMDAHRAGLQVFAADFANDNIIAYNYSYNPIAEYLSFIDNGIFSVDGVLSDSPITASEAIGCFSHINKTRPVAENLIIISHDGASGVYPGCTDLAYKQAVDDGADYIDCPVHVTRDGILICRENINLMIGTTVAKSLFNTHVSVIPALQSDAGVFTFNLTWEEIRTNLKPQISTPMLEYKLVRNPLYRTAGSFMSLTDFLAFAKEKALSGVLISIKHAAFLAENLGFNVTDAVLKSLRDSGYENQTDHKVIIQSTNSTVLKKLRQQSSYELVYEIDEKIGNVLPQAIKDISEFAHSVAIRKQSIYPDSQAYIIGKTDLVTKFHKANISVYAFVFLNEFVSQAWDFFSDATAEINTFAQDAGVDGIITDFPGTTAAYRRNSCLNRGNETPAYMSTVEPGGLTELLKTLSAAPPTAAPLPPLTVGDIAEPPLPPARGNFSTPAGGGAASPAPRPPSGQTSVLPAPAPPSGHTSSSASVSLCLVMIMGIFLLI